MASPALALEDAKLTPQELEQFTGIDASRYIAQRNQLRRWGIKAEINARREVVCFWSWIAAAGTQFTGAAPITELTVVDEADEDIGMNLEALRNG